MVDGCSVIESIKIAEDVIAEQALRYQEIDVYGFSSSAQLNVSGMPNLNNYFFSVSGENSSLREMRRMLTNSNESSIGTVDLDAFC